VVSTQFGGHGKLVDRRRLAHTKTKNAELSESARQDAVKPTPSAAFAPRTFPALSLPSWSASKWQRHYLVGSSRACRP